MPLPRSSTGDGPGHAWAHRLLLLRSERGKAKLEHVLRTDDPTEEIGAAWGIKEQLRLTLMSPNLAVARERKARFDAYVTWTKLPEADRLKKTIDSWWTEIETFIGTRVINAHTEAANVTIKNIKRTGRGYRSSHTNYRSRTCSTTPPDARREHPTDHAESRRHGMTDPG